jgi:hypothetical protein
VLGLLPERLGRLHRRGLHLRRRAGLRTAADLHPNRLRAAMNATSQADPLQLQPASLKDFLADCLALDADSFQNRHGKGYLLRSKYHREMQPLTDGHKTKTGGDPAGKDKVVVLPRPDFLVFPIQKRNANTMNDMISIGRVQKNDVVIRDGTLTAVLAFIKQGENGRFSILDAASKNGTFVNDLPVPAWGLGEPVELETGARVRFGSLEFTFLPAAEFTDLVKNLAGQ